MTARTVRPRWAWVLAVALALLGAAAVIVRPTAPPAGDPAAAAALTSYAPAVLARVEAWVTPIRTAYPLRLLAALGLPIALVVTGRGRRLLERLGGTRFSTLRGALVPLVLAAVAAAPFTWWLGWVHAGAFGFRTAGALRFATEAAGAALLDIGLTAVTALLALWMVRRRPHDWPAVGTLLGTALTAVLVLAQPLVVDPLLYAPAPLEDPVLVEAVAPVLARSELPDLELSVGTASVRTTRVNAVVSGIGPSRQVLLWDTLLELPVERVVAVVGHELAHAEHDDLPRAVLGSATGILVTLLLVRAGLRRWSTRPPDRLRGAHVGACAVVLLLVVEFVAAPVVAFESRRVEAAADHRALELVRDPAAQVAVQRGFVVDDLVDPTPPLWVRLLSSHPTTDQRIRAAVAFAEAEGLDPVPADDPSAQE